MAMIYRNFGRLGGVPFGISIGVLFSTTLAISTQARPATVSAGRRHHTVTPARARKATFPRYSNPVIDTNFPDPSILNDRGTYYAYATNSGGNLPTQRSTDLIHWTAEPDAMPVLPAWVKPGRTWAPDVAAIEPGKRYVVYFAAWDRSTNKQAVGAAVASSPTGPFVGTDAPMVEQASIGGAIDPTCFTDIDGDRYLLWKNDGNSMGVETWIWIQKLSPDGLSLVGTPVNLIKQDRGWEGNLIEAPTLWRHADKYYLFYSANNYASCNYAIGYAVSDSLRGPYVKPSVHPWISSTIGACGPGGEDIVKASDGSTWMAYHSWANGPHTYRCMNISRLDWVGDVPVLEWDIPLRARTDSE